MREYVIYEDHPASDWLDGTPVGCGRMGAMLLGGVGTETIYLNEETIWSSRGEYSPNRELSEKISHIRSLLLAGDIAEADRWALENLGGCFSRIASYESAGKLSISVHEDECCDGYRRELDLRRGIARVSYDRRGTHYTRECFASFPDDVIVFKMTSDNEPLALSISFARDNIISKCADDRAIAIMAKTALGNHRFCTRIEVRCDGKVSQCGSALAVSGAHECEIFIAIATEFRSASFEQACRIPKKGYEDLRAAHIADFSSLMDRCDIVLPEACDLRDISLHERLALERFNKLRDGALITLYFQFGRYLLISSSRRGTLPANLQGVWSRGLAAPWTCDYHTNINLQMNYWGAEVANLSECHEPLFDYMNNFLKESGKATARISYGLDGTVLHHLSDIYGFTGAADGLWGLWPLGGAWLCLHMWEHYLYTCDRGFLETEAYDYIEQCTKFFLQYMFEDEDGRLMTGPSASPENKYFVDGGDGEKYSAFLAMSPTMDIEVISALLRIYITASHELKISNETVDEAASALEKLPPLSIGHFGQLMEWLHDYEEVEPGHRHISHSFALYPDCAINRATPELYKAIGVTIDRRIEHGGGQSGWSCAWLIALYARLRRGSDALDIIHKLLTSCTNENLLDTHPSPEFEARSFFQIDGNLGSVGGIAEMLIQSHEGVISLLPALPPEWDSGSFYGLRARGGLELAARWEKHEIVELSISAPFLQEVELEFPEMQRKTTIIASDGSEQKILNRRLSVKVSKALTLTAK